MVRRGGLHVGVMGQFVMLALAWGASFLFIKVGLEGLSPPQVVLGRLLAGAAALAAVSLVGRRPLPRERPTRTTLSGLLVGFAGVVVVLGPWKGLAGGGGSGPSRLSACHAVLWGCVRLSAPVHLTTRVGRNPGGHRSGWPRCGDHTVAGAFYSHRTSAPVLAGRAQRRRPGCGGNQAGLRVEHQRGG